MNENREISKVHSGPRGPGYFIHFELMLSPKVPDEWKTGFKVGSKVPICLAVMIFRTCAFVFERTRTDDKSTPELLFCNVINVTPQVLRDSAGCLFSYFLSFMAERKTFSWKQPKVAGDIHYSSFPEQRNMHCIYMSRSMCNNIQVTRQAVLIRRSSEIPSSHLRLISSPALQVKSRHTAIKIKRKSYIAPEISRVAGKQNFVSG